MLDGTELLLADHRRVETLFAEFERDGDGDAVGRIVDALLAHDQAEHAALYPLVGSLLGDRDVVERAAVAHSRIAQAIEHLTDLEGPPLVAAVTELRTRVDEHVQDEERNILPALRDAATPGQLDELAARIEQSKQRVG